MVLGGTETVFMWQAASEEASAPAAEEPVKEEVAAVVPVQAQPQLASKKSATAKEIAITAHAERPRKAQVIKADKADMHDAPVSAPPAAPTATPTDVAVSSPLPCFRSCLPVSSAQCALHARVGSSLLGEGLYRSPSRVRAPTCCQFAEDANSNPSAIFADHARC